MNTIRQKLINWVIQELSVGVRNSHNSLVAQDVEFILREYTSTLRGDQLIMRLAANIRNEQIDRERALLGQQILETDAQRESNDVI